MIAMSQKKSFADWNTVKMCVLESFMHFDKILTGLEGQNYSNVLDKVRKSGHCARTRARMETRERNLLPLFHIGEPLAAHEFVACCTY